MDSFLKVNPDLLEELATDKDNSMRTYIDKSKRVRKLYWDRLRYMIEVVEDSVAQRVLDLGCGEGVFLPTPLPVVLPSVVDIDTLSDVFRKRKEGTGQLVEEQKVFSGVQDIEHLTCSGGHPD